MRKRGDAMADFSQPPRQEEIQYARDIIHGRHRVDLAVMLGATLIGAAFGVMVYVTQDLPELPFDILRLLLYVVICGGCLAVVAGLILASIRTIGAICEAWKPGRVVTIAAGAFAALNFLRNVPFWAMFPSHALAGIVSQGIFLIITLLLFTLGLRLVFSIRCAVKGVDDERVVARHIAAKDTQKKDPSKQERP